MTSRLAGAAFAYNLLACLVTELHSRQNSTSVVLPPQPTIDNANIRSQRLHTMMRRAPILVSTLSRRVVGSAGVAPGPRPPEDSYHPVRAPAKSRTGRPAWQARLDSLVAHFLSPADIWVLEVLLSTPSQSLRSWHRTPFSPPSPSPLRRACITGCWLARRFRSTPGQAHFPFAAAAVGTLENW
ncbi:hypothetical protein BN1723_007391 [Verticillium longisporum]|uniref:Secreted protein n=1 Tax=Verticillium longisporum TaxID=100787 RepID=A0A0G4NLA0_VERLO|nr:hypothetical protein BN1723_007391 [Verticillium longisporum]